MPNFRWLFHLSVNQLVLMIISLSGPARGHRLCEDARRRIAGRRFDARPSDDARRKESGWFRAIFIDFMKELKLFFHANFFSSKIS